ncbi:hemerythrin domain-containing protein [Nonomuraea soli]|uniref:Hemerythrin-like domain-containing protein n=1 Tax=Nonomuraea soli TaxID=1032476 RepID=A0A7W0CLL8_9ACTN|nr:hemerythrin domain-containing protein [Nonomuraea soli]MBA2893294.1 hemerythrin-like domain-containing protein [Nonomuraea soli]
MRTQNSRNARLETFGNQLISVHIWLREQLAELRDDVDAYLAGEGTRPQDLQTHCLTFCSALTRHHTGEDTSAFPALAKQFPELRPILDELGRDHEIVTDSMHKLQALLNTLAEDAPAPTPAEAQRIRGELNGLAALIETHFVYEEKRIVEALNSLRAEEWQATPPAFLLTSPPPAAPQ